MPESFRIQQALFGYREGHNLVAASVSLPPTVRHFLATVTDASGSEAAAEFGTAYTGLPVPDTDYYALFCTWPAPEMPRPGCVWSHVLLVELADLARIPDLRILRDFCVRPYPASPISCYETPLLVPDPTAHPTLSVAPASPGAASVLLALYTNPDGCIIILADQPARWEPAIFALWSQQWPRLRRNFAFSTASLGDRRLAGVNFDLQVAPPNTISLWRRAGLPTHIVDMPPDQLPTSTPSWARHVLADLNCDSTSALRTFLFTYGSDIEKPRQAFAKLATAYERLLLSPNSDWTTKLRSVAEIFPNKSEALRLKESLVKPQKAPGEHEDLERAWATASFLLDAPESAAYSTVSIDHSNWASLLWTTKRDEVLSLFARLVRHRERPNTTAFAAAVANAVCPADLQPIANRHPELIPILVSHAPNLAKDAAMWRLPGHTQWQAWEVLDRLSLDEQEWGEIEAAMFIAATYVAVHDTVKKAGQQAIQGAFRWLDNDVAQDYLPSEPWREALASQAAAALAGGKPLPPAQLALCAWLVSPATARKNLTASRQDVQTLAAQPLDTIPQPLRSHTAFLLVTLGLRASSLEGVTPLVRGFFPVHEALASVRFAPESWQILSPELPRLSVWRDWDRCEKLRRAVRAWLTEHVRSGNPLLEVADTASNQELARCVFHTPDDSDDFLD